MYSLQNLALFLQQHPELDRTRIMAAVAEHSFASRVVIRETLGTELAATFFREAITNHDHHEVGIAALQQIGIWRLRQSQDNDEEPHVTISDIEAFFIRFDDYAIMRPIVMQEVRDQARGNKKLPASLVTQILGVLAIKFFQTFDQYEISLPNWI